MKPNPNGNAQIDVSLNERVVPRRPQAVFPRWRVGVALLTGAKRQEQPSCPSPMNGPRMRGKWNITQL